MNYLNAEIGSAKDNSKSPIHNWYKFTAGFSYHFVEQIIKHERLALLRALMGRIGAKHVTLMPIALLARAVSRRLVSEQ